MKHPELLEGLESFGFSFIRIKPNDKRPDGNWKDAGDRINSTQAIERIKSDSNYGIVPPEGYFVIDFDSEDAYQRSISKSPIIADTLTFQTPRGYHVLFQGEGVNQTAGKTFLGEGVDIRSEGKGYIVGPGSTLKTGQYAYLSGDEILEAPETLRKLLGKPSTIELPPSMKQRPQSNVAPSSGIPDGFRDLTIMERGQAARKWWKALDEAQPGERNDTIAKAACGLGSIYGNADQAKREEIYARLVEHAERLGDGDSSEIQQNRTTANNQWQLGSESPATRPDENDASKFRMVFPEFEFPQFLEAMDNLGIQIRENIEFGDRIELFVKDDGNCFAPEGSFRVNDWILQEDGEMACLRNTLNEFAIKNRDEYKRVRISKEKFSDYISNAALFNKQRPFRDWIEGCQTNPDHEGLTLENWLDPWLVDSDSELNRWIAKAIFIGIVQKVYFDDQACRIIPTFRGDPGIGKTTMVSQLLPERFEHHFGNFSIRRDKDKMVGSIIGKFLVEAGELAGLSRSDTADFKQFIGSKTLTSRQPWMAHFKQYRNSAYIIGTVNKGKSIPAGDDAVNFRFVMLDLKKADDPKDYLPSRLEHLYALAREAYKAGERSGVLPEHLQEAQIETNAESVATNIVFTERLEGTDWRRILPRFKLIHVMEIAGILRRGSDRAPQGAETATLEYLKTLGVYRADMVHMNDGKYFQETDMIRDKRKQQFDEDGKLGMGDYILGRSAKRGRPKKRNQSPRDNDLSEFC